jgi:PAS domain-containing protein
MAQTIRPTNHEVFFDKGDIIVSKTDPKGRLTYCNDLFQKIAGFSEKELLASHTASSAIRTCRAPSSSCSGTPC